MKRIVLSLIAGMLFVGAQAQIQRGLQGTYNVDSFPKVTFVWNSANPEVYTASRFVLTEESQPLKFEMKVLPDTGTKHMEKSVLVLWEDMASHNRQSTFAAQLLQRFFQGTRLQEGDRFNVAVFNRHKNTDPQVLKPFANTFVSDGSQLANAIAAYVPSKEQFPTFAMESDLYLAINEGIAMLKKEPAERAGVIVVVTAGLNMKAAGASTEMETVRKNALDAGIPIYIINYPIAGRTPEAGTLAESTHGTMIATTDVTAALLALQQQYRNMDNRLRGHNYEFTFTTTAGRDGKPHPLCLSVDKVARPLPAFVAPSMTFGIWIKEHMVLFLVLVVVLIGLIVGAILLIGKRNKERKQQMQAQQMQAQQMQQDVQNQLNQQRQESAEAINQLRRENAAKNHQPQPPAEPAPNEAARLLKIMQTKNLYPRLQCTAGSEQFSYTVNSPVTTIGRDASNNVAFTMKNNGYNNQTVSGQHARIVFNGSAFEIVNVSRTYTRGIILNGQFCQRHTLSSGDIIGLGEATITFYL